ncbi:hypothetical protein BJY52DRAFT_1316567 [Lactarius psammicola]|nr:hypothetical protein BJY52DRAFT_1316567 [Lactarius psammicola]
MLFSVYIHALHLSCALRPAPTHARKTGDFSSNSRGGRLWRLRWIESASAAGEFEAEDMGRYFRVWVSLSVLHV